MQRILTVYIIEVAISGFLFVCFCPHSTPDCSASFVMAGMAYSKIGEHEKAIEDFTVVLQRDPEHSNAAFARAASYNTIGMFANAIEDYNLALLKDAAAEAAGYRPQQQGQDRNTTNNAFDSPYVTSGTRATYRGGLAVGSSASMLNDSFTYSPMQTPNRRPLSSQDLFSPDTTDASSTGSGSAAKTRVDVRSSAGM